MIRLRPGCGFALASGSRTELRDRRKRRRVGMVERRMSTATALLTGWS